MTETLAAEISIEGTLDSSPPVLPIEYGPVQLWDDGGIARFRVVTHRPPPEAYLPLIRRMQTTVEAAVFEATGVVLSAQADTSTYSINGRPAIRTGTAAFGYVAVTGPDPEVARQKGAQTASALLSSPDQRLSELWEIYLLGARAMRIDQALAVAPFCVVLEERDLTTGYKGKHFSHIRGRLRTLEQAGFPLPDPPERTIENLRSAGLHSRRKQHDKKQPPPQSNEVNWLHAVSWFYLTWRGTQGFTEPAQLPWP